MATRGRSYGSIERTAQKAITTLHRVAYNLSGGRLANTVMGNPIAILRTTGRKSGQPRETPLFAYPDGDDLIVVGSNGGTASAPAWLLNLEADPAAMVRVAGVDHPVRAEVLSPEEKATWWPELVRRYPSYASYQAKTDREIPVVRLHRV